MTEMQGTFRGRTKTLEENYKRMNENWGKELMKAIPEHLRSKVRHISDDDKEIRVGFTGLSKEND